MRLEYTKDVSGCDILQDKQGTHQVMMEWEQEYMTKCIDRLSPYGNVLEIGFGLGYSANRIQSFSIKSHTIIECNPTVLKKAHEWANCKTNPVKIVPGRWEDVLETVGIFDCIFFDDYCSTMTSETVHRFDNFLKDILMYHSKIGTRIVVFSTQKIQYNTDVVSVENFTYDCTIPKYCKYAHGNSMNIPVITKCKECREAIKIINIAPQMKASTVTPHINPTLYYPEPMRTFRFHVFSLPHTVTTPEYNACAYTMKVLKFCKMMKARGHYIIHYGHEDSIVDCDEHVTLTTNEDLKKAYGSYDWKKEFFKHNTGDHCHIKFNTMGSMEVLRRLQSHDFVLPFWGRGHMTIINSVNEDGRGLVVEPGIGYHDSFCKFRIFESWCVAHHTFGLQKIYKPSWYHAVIPNYFDIRDFEYSAKKSDYFLYLGRISVCKGTHIAVQVTEKIGAKLVIAGQGDVCTELGYDKIPEHVEYVGYADVEKRKELLRDAKGLFILSDYVEPFGGVAIEAMISGTPVIASDWGVFTETILHGVTGYRVRTFEQMCWAARNIHNIDSTACRIWAESNFSLEKVATMYEEYFYQVDNLWNEGWYEQNEERLELNWLYKHYPLSNPQPVFQFAESRQNKKIVNKPDADNKIIEDNAKPKFDINKLELGDIFLKYNTDKFNNEEHGHTYHLKYQKLFKELRNKPIKLFEMGIGSLDEAIPSNMSNYNVVYNYQSGASLKAWKEYFYHKDTKIYGGDIDAKVCIDYGNNIITAQMDQQSDESLQDFFFNKKEYFDIIIDDGLHTEKAAQTTYKNTWNSLKKNGFYIIEDINLNLDNFLPKGYHKYTEKWSHKKKSGKIEDNYLTVIRKPDADNKKNRG